MKWKWQGRSYFSEGFCRQSCTSESMFLLTKCFLFFLLSRSNTYRTCKNHQLAAFSLQTRAVVLNHTQSHSYLSHKKPHNGKLVMFTSTFLLLMRLCNVCMYKFTKTNVSGSSWALDRWGPSVHHHLYRKRAEEEEEEKVQPLGSTVHLHRFYLSGICTQYSMCLYVIWRHGGGRLHSESQLFQVWFESEKLH